MRVISRERCPSRAAMASRRMPRLMAWVARVWRSRWGCMSSIPAMAPMRAMRRCTVRRSIGAWPSARSRRVRRMCSALVAVQLANRSTTLGCSGIMRSLRSSQTGAGKHLGDESIARNGMGAGGGHERGGLLVGEESGDGLGARWDVAVQDRVPSRGVRPVPFDEPLEKDPDHPQPVPLGVLGEQLALLAGLGGEPHLVVLDVAPGDLG